MACSSGPNLRIVRDTSGSMMVSVKDEHSSENFMKYLENLYTHNREDIIQEDGYINTPLAVLHDLAKKNLDQIHVESHEVRLDDNAARFLVEIIVGDFRGLGEASRMKVAKQIAAADLLEQIKALGAGAALPAYGLLPGTRIGPSIFSDLKELCSAIKVPIPQYIELPRDPENPKAPLFTFKCQIGQLITTGFSDAGSQARRWAAKKMYETLSGEKYPLENIDYGSKCRIMERLGLTARVSKQKIELLARLKSVGSSNKNNFIDSGLTAAEARYYSDDEDDDEEISTLTQRNMRTVQTVDTMEQSGRLSQLRRQFNTFNIV